MNKSPNGMQSYLRLLTYLKPHKSMFMLSIVGFVTFAASQPALAQLFEFMVEALEVGKQDARFSIPLFLVGIFVVRGLGTFVGVYCMSRVAFGIVKTLRQQMFDHFVMLPNNFFDRHSSGDLISKINYNTSQVTQAVTDALKTCIREGASVIALLSYMIIKEWRLTLIMFAVVPVLALVVVKVSGRLRRLSRGIQDSMGDVTNASSEMISNYKVMRTFGGEAYEKNRFAKANNRNYRQNIKLVLTVASTTPILQVIVVSALGVMMYVMLTYFPTDGAGPLIAYLGAASQLPGPIRRLAEVNGKIQKGIAAADSIFEQIDQVPENNNGVIEVDRSKGRIEFREVSFQYEFSERLALNKVSFIIEPGQTVALVGRSGSGKTSLVSLLPRFYDHLSGEVLLDGEPIQSLELRSLRRQIALVNQNIDLFNDTIAHNIAYGDMAGATLEQIKYASDMAYATEFIDQLPEQFDTMIGEDGARLSGGQRQRLAIARALLKDAPVLILDEATSALDNESEKAIQKAMERVMAGRTTLVVAHRLSTIENADLIVVMDQGSVVEKGTHSELLALGGLYSNLHAHNFDEDTEV